MEILKNRWVKLSMSVVSVLYVVLIGWLSYMSLFYEIGYTSKVGFGIFYLLITGIYIGISVLTRDQLFTRIGALVLMILAFPMVLLNFGDWLLIVPAFAASLAAFFSIKAKGNFKTVMGTIFLLMYVVGGLAFFVVLKLFFPPTEKDIIETGLSATGAYRYEVWEITDNSRGSTKVMVEPNDKDEKFLMIKFKAKGYSKIVYNKRNHNPVSVVWTDNDMLFLNGKKYEFTIDKREIVLN